MAFEAILSNQRMQPKGWQRITLVGSVVLHVAALVAGVVHSIWQVEEMPMPSLEVTLAAAPPPPPPPPPPAAKKASNSQPKTRPVEPTPQDLVVPKDVPKDSKPVAQETSAEGQEDGQLGGVQGGVAGGVEGGVLGGVVGAAPPPPPPKPAGPKMLSAKLGRGQLLIDPNDERYRVKLPPPLARSGETYVALLKVCVSTQGTVTSVQLMKSATAAIDGQFPSVIGRWRYRPLVADGVATPFCYPLRYEVSGR